MTGIILTMGSAGLMCAAGLGLSTALKWFHSYDPDLSKKHRRDVSLDDPHEEHINSIRKRIRKTNV